MSVEQLRFLMSETRSENREMRVQGSITVIINGQEYCGCDLGELAR
jgi:hypothetical protein